MAAGPRQAEALITLPVGHHTPSVSGESIYKRRVFTRALSIGEVCTRGPKAAAAAIAQTLLSL